MYGYGGGSGRGKGNGIGAGPGGRRMTGSASQAMDVVFRLLLGEKILGRGSRGREGLGIGPPPEAGG